MAGALVGNVGAIATGTTTVTPAYGQATTAGHLLVARICFVGNATVATTATGWVQAIKVANSTAINSAIWYKPNSGASETAPTFTVASGTYLAADLSEWSGIATSSPLDQTTTGTGASTNPFVQATNADAAAGDVQIAALGTSASKSGTLTFTDGWSPAATPAGSAHGTGTTSTTKHAWLTANIGDGSTGFNSVTISTSSTWAMVLATFKTPPVPPSAPQNMGVGNATASGIFGIALSSGQLMAHWTAPVSGTGLVYDLYRSPDNVTFTAVTTGLTVTSYTDTGLTNGSTYYYYVIARNSAGTAQSSTASNSPTVFTRSNSFEGETVGARVSTDQAVHGGDPFDSSASTPTYTATAAHGSVAVSTGNNFDVAKWYIPGLATLYCRAYFQFQGTTNLYGICSFWDDAGQNFMKLWVQGGVLGICDMNGSFGAPAAPVRTFTTALSINTWYRVEAQVHTPSASAVKPTVRLYTSMDSATVTEEITPTTGTFGNGANFDHFTLDGSNSGLFSLVDDLAVSEVGWIGPFSGGAPPAVVPTQGGTGLRVISKWR